jgi:hypothetical protein
MRIQKNLGSWGVHFSAVYFSAIMGKSLYRDCMKSLVFQAALWLHNNGERLPHFFSLIFPLISMCIQDKVRGSITLSDKHHYYLLWLTFGLYHSLYWHIHSSPFTLFTSYTLRTLNHILVTHHQHMSPILTYIT